MIEGIHIASLSNYDYLRVTGTPLIDCTVLIIGKYSTESEK